MRAASWSLLLLQLAGLIATCFSSSFKRTDFSGRASRASRHCRIDRRVSTIRGGQQLPDDGGAEAITPPIEDTFVQNFAQESTLIQPVAEQNGSPPISSDWSKNAKISNFKERAPPALLMLSATYLLLRFSGEKGLIGLILVMQTAMYSEAVSVVDGHNTKKGLGSIDEIASFPFQKWWWFATVLATTSIRSIVTKYTSLSNEKMSFVAFGMSAIGLVWAVVQLAMVNSISTEETYRNFLEKVACCHFSLLFLVGQSSFWIKTVQEYGLIWVLFPAFLVIVNDTMAYIFGVLLGKHKLIPRLSPKKTVEGFVGAGLSTLAVAVPLLKRMLGDSVTSDTTRHAIILALYVSLVSPFGGFLASAVKRAHGAKDFGRLIPGHGGVVDRFDCQVVTAPFVYLYLKNFFDVGRFSASD
mmetsp:Transcript_22886/g.44314  ORF Transcript_22886/g.44314 Transcript_22886/m.44314 type:complete len:413 (+) Transcript_22886:62-1300(+)